MSLQSPHRWAVAAGIAVPLLLGAGKAQTAPLGSYNAPLTETSVSGISSGAYMAVQLGTAWSSIIKGVGAIAGGPFGCAEGSEATALSTCMMGQPAADLAELERHETALAAAGRIDSLDHIAYQKYYLFSGYNDVEVHRSVTDWLDRLTERRLGAPAGNLFYQTAIGAGHAQVTFAYGNACAANRGHYIDKCGYDQAGIILQHMYGALAAPNRGALKGTLTSFSQAAYTAPARPAEFSLGEAGFVFVPSDCAAGAACRVHVALHGCKQSYATIHKDYILHAGYNEWADTNRIIVLYPQAAPSNGDAPFFGISNPYGCWDWWGYLDKDPQTDPRYLTRDAPQIATLKRMIDRLTAGAQPSGAVAPPGPQALVVNDASDRAVALAWTAVPGALRYEVLRDDGQASVSLGTAAGLSFGDSGLKPKTAYRYQVRPILAAGPGPLTAAVQARTRATPPPCHEPGTCKVAK